jgi:hypothetical protein
MFIHILPSLVIYLVSLRLDHKKDFVIIITTTNATDHAIEGNAAGIYTKMHTRAGEQMVGFIDLDGSMTGRGLALAREKSEVVDEAMPCYRGKREIKGVWAGEEKDTEQTHVLSHGEEAVGKLRCTRTGRERWIASFMWR